MSVARKSRADVAVDVVAGVGVKGWIEGSVSIEAVDGWGKRLVMRKAVDARWQRKAGAKRKERRECRAGR
jgi:hypothetical protein